MKKFATLFLTLSVVCCLLFALPLNASAASTGAVEGLEVSLQTDKDTYAENEEIVVTLSIKNTHTFEVSGVSIDTLIPDGLNVKSGDLDITNITIPAGETYTTTVKTEMKPEETKPEDTNPEDTQSPQTGDNSNIALWIVLLVISSTAMIVLSFKNKKNATRVLSLFLCVAMIGTALPLGALAAESNTASITVDKTITVGGKEFTLKSTITVNKTTEATEHTVSFDLNYEGATGTPENQTIPHGFTATEPNAPTREGYYFAGWFTDVNEADLKMYFDFASEINTDTVLYAKWVDATDTDGEGLVDGLETVYGTDKTKQDTDKDGLNDYLEVMLFNTNPLVKDSDGNGVNDGDEDFDSDGLSNLSELAIDTNPLEADTDDDGLNDGDEKNTHGTNPLLSDTDGDDVSDGKEVELGTNPLVAQSTFNMNLSAENEDSVTASVQIELPGEQVESLRVEPVENSTLFSTNIPGYLGRAYEFNVDGSFESATLNFEFDNALVGDANVDPTIYYYNEETGLLEELPTVVTGNVASAEVSHFSKYILINRKVYNDSFTWTDVWDSNQNYTDVEIVFVIDDSGSMDLNDPSYERLNVARTLIDNLPSNSKIGLVRFDGDWPKTEALTKTLTTDKEEVKNYLTRTYFYSPGGTDMYNGIQKAFPLYESTESTTLKMMIVLSDGETDDTYLHSSVVNTANNSNIRIYTVGLGSSTSYFNNYLKPLANNTGAAFYLASDAEQLSDIYKSISEKIDIETDSDADGIPDYYEDNLVLFNGIKIQLDKNNPDTDGDGLLDGKEVELTYTYSPDRSQVVVKGKINCDPKNKDSDNDGYTDDEDLNPTVPYKTPIILLHGLNDNTTCYGVKTPISKDMNTDYGSDKTKPNSNGKQFVYTDCESHKIISISSGRLGAYLRDTMGYEQNKNLFAFNYPNHDMVQFNGLKLSGYINSLIGEASVNGNDDVVLPEYVFATHEDKRTMNVKFILIGHSMGGLVSRYYIENIGTSHVDRLITIDTPHYGSGLADASDATGDVIVFSPSIFDLDTKSTLYGGKAKTWDFTLGGIFRNDSKYAIENQSPALKGNKNISIPYYAIGGYDVGRGWIGGELGQLADGLQNTVFGFEFNRSVSSKDAYKTSINSALDTYSRNLFNATSKLDLGDADGDNTVDHMSQFAIRFNSNKVDYQKLERTVLVVNSKDDCGLANPFHNKIHTLLIMHKTVGDFIND